MRLTKPIRCTEDERIQEAWCDDDSAEQTNRPCPLYTYTYTHASIYWIRLLDQLERIRGYSVSYFCTACASRRQYLRTYSSVLILGHSSLWFRFVWNFIPCWNFSLTKSCSIIHDLETGYSEPANSWTHAKLSVFWWLKNSITFWLNSLACFWGSS